jgi:Rad51
LTSQNLLQLLKLQPFQIRIIVIDSFSAFLRDFDHLEKIRIIYEILDALQSFANDNECAVILTNDLTPDITTADFTDSVSPMKPALGPSHFHRIQQRILLTKGHGGTIVAGVQKNLTGVCSGVRLRITKSGVVDA